MGLRLRHRLNRATMPFRAAYHRARAAAGRPPRFAGAFPNRSQALSSLPAELQAGYDDETVADVSFDKMCAIASWDYPVLFWLRQTLRPGLKVVDAGGHLGTKYIGFRTVLDLRDVSWTVFDLPGIIRAARTRQQQGELPSEIAFVDTADLLPQPDVLLASGLLQYLDQPVAEFLSQHGAARVILNKVALRDGPGVVTLETIGHARVPYQIRNRTAFEADLAAAGYEIKDSWANPVLGHRIGTHPALGLSESRGYVLDRAQPRKPPQT